MKPGAWRVVAAAVAWCIGAAWVFMLFVGEWTAVDWVGAGCTGFVTAAMTAPLVKRRMFAPPARWRWLRILASALLQVVPDFWTVSAELARALSQRRRDAGRFVGRHREAAHGDGREETRWRAFVTLAATLSPNAYVVDFAPDGRRLLHDLVPKRASEKPA